jgi:hypothetical protein
LGGKIKKPRTILDFFSGETIRHGENKVKGKLELTEVAEDTEAEGSRVIGVLPAEQQGRMTSLRLCGFAGEFFLGLSHTIRKTAGRSVPPAAGKPRRNPRL